MTDKLENQQHLARLKEVLDLFGADSLRWPQEERALLEEFVRENDDAKALVGQEQAFDQVLNFAPAGSLPSEVKSRLLKHVLQDKPGAEAEIIPLNAGHYGTLSQIQIKKQAWPVAALLAASLVLGLYLGAAGLTGTAFENMLGTPTVEDNMLAGVFPQATFEDGVVAEDLL